MTRWDRSSLVLILLLFFAIWYYVEVFSKPTFKSVMENATSGLGNEYSVVIEDFKNPQRKFLVNESRKYSAASLYKLWVMAVVFEKIRDGLLEENEVLSEDAEVLNRQLEIASESAEVNSGIISLSVHDAIEQMITISHNYAALLLSNRVGYQTISDFLEREGFTHSTYSSPPKTTASDIALFFEKLYRKELVSKLYSEKMLEILSKQRVNDRIPKYLPRDVRIAHKTGELGFTKHDVGIVYSKKADYLMVILSETDNPVVASNNIANASKKAYNYFNN